MSEGPEGEEREKGGGPPAERLREQLEREFGEVPPESPSEPDEKARKGEEEEQD